MFNSYVKLPEGMPYRTGDPPCLAQLLLGVDGMWPWLWCGFLPGIYPMDPNTV